jgi:hypothetical protein
MNVRRRSAALQLTITALKHIRVVGMMPLWRISYRNAMESLEVCGMSETSCSSV